MSVGDRLITLIDENPVPPSTPWRMPVACADCPFNETGKGYKLRKSLRAGRWKSILTALLNDDSFMCHKTTTGDEDDPKEPLVCAGSIEWQAKRGIVSQYARICQRLEASHGRR